jgi:hypothetical protein
LTRVPGASLKEEKSGNGPASVLIISEFEYSNYLHIHALLGNGNDVIIFSGPSAFRIYTCHVCILLDML